MNIRPVINRPVQQAQNAKNVIAKGLIVGMLAINALAQEAKQKDDSIANGEWHAGKIAFVSLCGVASLLFLYCMAKKCMNAGNNTESDNPPTIQPTTPQTPPNQHIKKEKIVPVSILVETID